jgi:NAD(P)-dependent dehydrogenase (short-subunit alcohol dehydrogenase family)
MDTKLFDLHGKIAIVTGASRGLGKAMALGLAQAGATVVLADILDTKDAVNEVKNIQSQSIGLQVDVTDKSSVDEMVKKVKDTFRRIDILVNNAGVLRSGNAEALDLADWEKVLNVNLTGEFLCAQAVGKQMIAQKSGKIINISSVAGLFGSESSAPYCASKAGVIMLTKTLAAEWAKHHITVNSICPGVFATDMTDSYLKDEEFHTMIKNDVPLGRYAKPEELIGTVIYLASAASDYVTGHALVIDGGWTAAL